MNWQGMRWVRFVISILGQSWLKDESLEDLENLPDADVLALEIMENLEAALEQFSGIVDDLGDES